MKLSTAVWHLLHGKPILDRELRRSAVKALRESPDYLKDIMYVAESDYEETLSPKLEKKAHKYREQVKITSNKGGKIAPQYIILHHTAGSFIGSVSWVMDPVSDVSYHYIIDPETGNRIQHVFDTDRAWHAGRSKYKGLTAFNGRSIGIAFAGNTHKRYPIHAEIDSCARKCIYLMDKFNIPESNILTHAIISPGRKDDCNEETRQRVLRRIDQLTL